MADQSLMYRKGLAPIMPSRRHPGSVLQSQGWRTLHQMKHPKKMRGKGLLAKVGDKEYARITAPERPMTKRVRKNTASKLYEFLSGRYHRK